MTLPPKTVAGAVSMAIAVALFGAAAPGFASTAGQFSVSVLVDGVPAPEYAARGRIYLEALRGRSFAIRLSNPTVERMAVALSVDGRNVIDAKRSSAERATKWILMPGQTVEIPGWQVSGEVSRRFFFTETARSYARWLGDTANVGTIEAVFYRERRRIVAAPAWREERGQRSADPIPEGEARPSVPPPAARADAGEGRVEGGAAEPGFERFGGLERKESPAVAPSAGMTGQATMPRQSPSDYAATGIGDRTRFPVEWVSFDEEAAPVARVALRYEFRAELVALGVLSREDDLYARDRGRGFEREFAPDPYRHR